MKILTSAKINKQGLNGYIKPFLGIALLSESKYNAATDNRDRIKRHAEQLDFSSRLTETLRKAASENGIYNRLADGSLSNDYGKIEASMLASSVGSAHSIQVKIQDNRRSNLFGILNVLSISVNFDHKGEEVHVRFHENGKEERFSKEDKMKIDRLAKYLLDYKAPDIRQKD